MTDPREDALAAYKRRVREWLDTATEEQVRRSEAAFTAAALSALAAQSEGDDELDRTKLIADAADAHAFSQWSDKLGHRRMEAALAVIEPAIRADERAAVARKALTPSPTPYVRPAAEIQAEIERAKKYSVGSSQPDHVWRFYEGFVEGLTFALTPPTQEPR